MVLSEHTVARPAATRLPSLSLVLACEPAQVANVRAIVAAALATCPRRDDVVLVASELASNAVAHSTRRPGGTFTVQLHTAQRAVELRVHDAGGDSVPELLPEPPDPLQRPDPLDGAAEHGRGLRLVDAYADRWDHHTGDDGCTVWAAFTLPGAPPAAGPGTDFTGPGDVAQPPEAVLHLLSPN